IREYIEEIWNRYNVSGKIEYINEFEKIFEELFRFFLRPFEIIIFNEKMIRSIIPIQEIFVSKDFVSAYNELMDNLLSHMKLTFQLFSQPFIEKMPIEKFIREWMDFVRRLEITHEMLYDLPFALPENAKNYLMDCLSTWNYFFVDYGKYRDLLRNAFIRSVENFCDFATKSKLNSFDDFRNSFQEYLAKEFDSLLKSEEYLQLQKKLFDALFDHIYCLRRFLELMIENNPASPFATISQIDEAYKRIMDLKRKISDLEKRIEFLEGKYVGKD
ncbi:MAG: hypothetical protein N3A69_13590, partial [Leptospiraceae bacterium]|nr:hypothetical protein [Leptospiraceae bacterium]